MNFELSEEQQLLLRTVDNFVKKDSPVQRFREQRDVDPGWSKDIWAKMGELGWLGLPFPESAGGLGCAFVDTALLLERLGTALVPEPYLSSVLLAGMSVAKAGNPGQHERYLAPMIAGKTTLALAYTEKGGRHDVAHVAARAEKNGDGYLLNGEKRWVLHGDSADQLVVSARTSGQTSDRDGVSLFIVDATAEGVRVQPLKTYDGRRAAHVELRDARVSTMARLGPEGSAVPLLEEVLDVAAAGACAEGAGILETVTHMTRDYLCERVQFGVPIGTFQALQHRAVDMFVELQLCRATMLLAALRLDPPENERKWAVSTAKAQLAEGGHFIVRQGVHLHGGIGVTDEHNVGLYFKRMHVLNALFGDQEHHVQRFSRLPGFDAVAV
jgi:alkylation response protein AidB-like acyl-CoA dehydrogenase